MENTFVLRIFTLHKFFQERVNQGFVGGIASRKGILKFRNTSLLKLESEIIMVL